MTDMGMRGLHRKLSVRGGKVRTQGTPVRIRWVTGAGCSEHAASRRAIQRAAGLKAVDPLG